MWIITTMLELDSNEIIISFNLILFYLEKNSQNDGRANRNNKIMNSDEW